MFLKDGKKLATGVPFSLGDGDDLIQYPANWLEMASEDDLAALGIEVVDDPIRPDDRYYDVTENDDGTFTAEPKPLEELKAWRVGETKTAAAFRLQPTDWMVVRATETDKPVPADVQTYRAAVRAASNGAETAINACASAEELAGLVIEWPEVPA